MKHIILFFLTYSRARPLSLSLFLSLSLSLSPLSTFYLSYSFKKSLPMNTGAVNTTNTLETINSWLDGCTRTTGKRIFRLAQKQSFNLPLKTIGLFSSSYSDGLEIHGDQIWNLCLWREKSGKDIHMFHFGRNEMKSRVIRSYYFTQKKLLHIACLTNFGIHLLY